MTISCLFTIVKLAQKAQFQVKMCLYTYLRIQYLQSKTAGVDPTKLFFFANKEFLRFFAGKLAFLLHTEKKFIDIKMT